MNFSSIDKNFSPIDLVDGIAKDIEPLFKYKNSDNDSYVLSMRSSIDNQKVRIICIYERCIACNVPRFNFDELIFISAGTNLTFCDSCYRKLVLLTEKYKKNKKTEELFEKMWMDRLWGPTNNKNICSMKDAREDLNFKAKNETCVLF